MRTFIIGTRYIGPSNVRGSRMRIKLAGHNAKFVSYTEWEDKGAFTCIREYVEERVKSGTYRFHVSNVGDCKSAPDGHDTLHIVSGFDKPISAA